VIRNSNSAPRSPILRWVALTCVFAILIGATLQATHIHKEWTTPVSHHTSFHTNVSNDGQCVFCLTSHTAAGLPLHFLAEQIQSSAADLRTELPHYFPVLDVGAHTIRPPPIA
jgi:hypothetical protein